MILIQTNSKELNLVQNFHYMTKEGVVEIPGTIPWFIYDLSNEIFDNDLWFYNAIDVRRILNDVGFVVWRHLKINREE